MPELHQLRQLVTIAEAGTLSNAAELLHISQPALSRSVQKLESEWNVTLFDRRKNRITLNKTGELAVQHARQVLAAADQLTQAVQAFDRSQHSIAVGSCAPAPIIELLYSLSERFVGMKLFSETVNPDILLPGLKNGSYQVIITDHPVDEPGLLCHKLCTERLFLVVPASHPLAARTGTIYAEELAGMPMLIYKEIGVWQNFVDAKMSRTDFIVQDSTESFSSLLRLSEFLSFATDLTLKHAGKKEDRVYLPFLDPEATLTFYCCVKKEHRAYLPA